MKVSILGSCVTRDLFEFLDTDWSVVTYVSRQSMISAVTEPLTLKFVGDEAALSQWRRSMVLADAEKRSMGMIADDGAEVLIVDMCDERCLCAADEQGRLVTYSPELQELAANSDFLKLNGLRVLGDEWPYMKWRENALDAFCARLEEVANGRPIVLHESYWAERVVGPQPRSYDANWVRRNNDLFELCYAGVARRLPVLRVEVPRGETLGDSAHRWGAAPYHYTIEYYVSIFEQLQRVLGQQVTPPRVINHHTVAA